MASVKEVMQIIESTPVEQPIMLEGIHGIGKSETVDHYFKKKGYRVIVLLLGQMSDAGDILGLPERRTIKVDGKSIRITDFTPPSWWPHKKDEKCILFLDELNRARPELHQVVMDLVLNRKLYNRVLPPDTRIVAAINPLDGDGIYQVEEMDPALIDRFNKYRFNPTAEEWIDWASRNKVDNKVIGFISQHNDHLDPPDGKEYKQGAVYPSRRSWVRVSSIIKTNGKLLQDINVLKTMMLGIVGERSTSAFGKYLKEVGTGLNAGVMITSFHENGEKFEKILKGMNIQDFIHMNNQVVGWFKDNTGLLSDENKVNAQNYCANLKWYLDSIPAETMAEFFSIMSKSNDAKEEWPKLVMRLNGAITDRFVSMLNGEDDEDEKLNKNISK